MLIASVYAHSRSPSGLNDHATTKFGLVCQSWNGALKSVLCTEYLWPLVKSFAPLMKWEGVYLEKEAFSFKTWDWLLCKISWYGLSTKQKAIQQSVDFMVDMTQKKTNKAMKCKSLYEIVNILFYMDTGYVELKTDEKKDESSAVDEKKDDTKEDDEKGKSLFKTICNL